MIEQFELARVGFHRKVQVGDMLEYADGNWVIIRILDLRYWMTHKGPRIVLQVLAQKVGVVYDYSTYYRENTLKKRYPLEKVNTLDVKIKKVGEVVFFRDNKRDVSIPFIITHIENYDYEFTDLIVRYGVELVEPWPVERMDEAVQQRRMATFTIIEGKKNDA